MLLDEEEKKKKEEEAKKIINSVNINEKNSFADFSNNNTTNNNSFINNNPFMQSNNDEENYKNKLQEAKDIISSVYTKKNSLNNDSNNDTNDSIELNTNTNSTDISESTEKNSKIDLINSGTFSDGYQFGDASKTILGTTLDITQDLASGAASVIEAPIDIGANVVASIQDLLGFDEAAKKSREWANKNYSKKFGTLVANATPVGTLYHLTNGTFGQNIFENEAFEKNSLLGETSDKIINLVGYVGGLAAGGYVLEGAGMASNLAVNIGGHTLNLPTLAITRWNGRRVGRS